MNYLLAKELKDAGFPTSVNWEDEGDGFYEQTAYGRFPVPTLEELIEACRTITHNFSLFNGGRVDSDWPWMANARNKTDELLGGNTPTEAVACLWLALNKPSLATQPSSTPPHPATGEQK